MPVVLVTDADRELTDVFRAYLLKGGYRVETASGGLECLQKLRQCSPDVLVLDRELPWGGGDGVLACLSEAGPGVSPAVVLTTRDIDSPDEPLDPPIVGYLRKPFALAELLKRIAAAHELQEGKQDGIGTSSPCDYAIGGHGRAVPS